MTTTQDYKAQLAKQLGFVERSAVLYDKGFTDEAFRIATALRVVFHQTQNSASLMTHLGSPICHLRSTVPDMSLPPLPANRTAVKQFLLSLVTVTLSNAGPVLLPKTEVAQDDRLIPWGDWWSEVFATLNDHDYSRKALVLWMANKDGGAHVDASLKPEYEAIKASAALGTFRRNGQSIPIENAHLVFLRSMAFEVLNSSELRTLAGL
jgi:hypothetical protein